LAEEKFIEIRDDIFEFTSRICCWKNVTGNIENTLFIH